MLKIANWICDYSPVFAAFTVATLLGFAMICVKTIFADHGREPDAAPRQFHPEQRKLLAKV